MRESRFQIGELVIINGLPFGDEEPGDSDYIGTYGVVTGIDEFFTVERVFLRCHLNGYEVAFVESDLAPATEAVSA